MVIEVTDHMRTHGSIARATITATRQGDGTLHDDRRDTMDYEATIEDPSVFSKPWKIKMPLYRRREPTFS